MVTQKTIATLLGISQPTVGAVLGKHSNRSKIGVSPELRQRILDKAQELGYRPNLFAQAMTGARTRVIGVIFYPDSVGSTSPQETQLCAGIERAGYRAITVRGIRGKNADEGAVYVRDLVDQMLDLRVDGVMIAFGSSYVPTSELMRLMKAGVPVVTVNGELHPGIAHVAVDVEAGMELLVEHLLSFGYRRLLLSDSPPFSTSEHLKSFRYSDLRRAAFIKALERRKAEVVQLGFVDQDKPALPAALRQRKRPVGIIAANRVPAIGQGEFEAGAKLIESLVRHRIPADAILFRNDTALQGALRATQELGVRVPEQYGMTGHDGVIWGQYGSHPFTTIRMPYREIAEKALQLLLAQIENGIDTESCSIRVPGYLIAGATTRQTASEPPHTSARGR